MIMSIIKILICTLSIFCLFGCDFGSKDEGQINNYLKSKDINAVICPPTPVGGFRNKYVIENGDLYYIGGIKIKLPSDYSKYRSN